MRNSRARTAAATRRRGDGWGPPGGLVIGQGLGRHGAPAVAGGDPALRDVAHAELGGGQAPTRQPRGYAVPGRPQLPGGPVVTLVLEVDPEVQGTGPAGKVLDPGDGHGSPGTGAGQEAVQGGDRAQDVVRIVKQQGVHRLRQTQPLGRGLEEGHIVPALGRDTRARAWLSISGLWSKP